MTTERSTEEAISRRHRARRPLGAGLVTAIVAGTLALAFGTGYVANKASFTGPSAWLADGKDASLVSAGGGEPQDRVSGAGRGHLVQNDDDTFQLVEDRGDGRRIQRYGPNAATGQTGKTGRPLRGGPRSQVLTADGRAWLVDPDAGTVQPLYPDTFTARGRPVRSGKLVGQAVGTDGTLWVLDRQGTVRRLAGRKLADPRTVDLGRPAAARLTVVGDQPVVIDPAAGVVHALGGDTFNASALRGTVLVVPSQPGPELVAIGRSGRQATLVAVDLADGVVGEAELGADPVAAPLLVGSDVYVPTVTEGSAERLRRFTLPGLQETDPLAVPQPDKAPKDRSARDGDLGFDAFLKGRRLWANDPASRYAVTVVTGEPSTKVDKVGETAKTGSGEKAPSKQTTPTTSDLPPVPKPGGGGAPNGSPTKTTPGGSGPSGTPSGGAGGPGGSGSLPPVPTAPPATTPTTPPPANTTPAKVEVPSVVGLDQDAACGRIEGAQLQCVRNPVPDRSKEKYQVYEQSPRSGQVTPNTKVTITYATPESVTVPQIDDSWTREQACAELQARGLVCADTARTDAPADATVPNVVAGTVDPAPGQKVDTGTEVSFEWYQAYAQATFQDSEVLGQPSGACARIQDRFPNCQEAPGSPAPNPGAAGTIERADPPGGTPYPVNQVITLYVYGAYVPKTGTTPGTYTDCGQITSQTLTADGQPVGITCNEQVTSSPGAPAAPGSLVGWDVPPGSTVGEGQNITIVRYQPAYRSFAMVDWYDSTSPGGNIHTIRPAGPPPGSGEGGGTPENWVSNGSLGQTFDGPEAYTAPIYCYRNTVTLQTGERRTYHYCGMNGPPGPVAGQAWTIGNNGAPMGYAYNANPGPWAVLVQTCLIGGRAHYYTHGGCSAGGSPAETWWLLPN